MIPKKKFGQHFLADENIAKKIVNELNYKNKKQKINCIEIGPGKGILSKYLIKKTEYNLKMVEIDHDTIKYLNNNLPELNNKIIHADILKLNIPENFTPPIIIIGNLPYNITAPIFFKILENKNIIQQVVAMIQKEVAQRIVASHNNKTYGILSVLLQTFYKIEYLFEVGNNVFSPKPKVNSAVIKLTKTEIQPHIKHWNKYKKLVKTAFNQRRKTLKNALKIYDTTKIPQKYLKLRAEQLSVDNFLEIYNKLIFE